MMRQSRRAGGAPPSTMTPAEPAADDLRLEPERLAAVRRRLGLPADGPACAAPFAMAVVERDGRISACEFGAALPAEGTQPLGALQARLRESVLPGWHCGRCIRACASGLPSPAAPFLREYGTLSSAAPGRPSQLVLRLPSGPLADGVLARVDAWLPGLRVVVLESDGPVDGPAFDAILPRLAGRELRVRLRVPVLDRAAAERLAGLVVESIELDLSGGCRSDLAESRAVAVALGAELRARFVPTPAHWFELDSVAVACASGSVLPLELALERRDGSVPFDGVAVDDLAFVRRVLGSSWDRLGSEVRPLSLEVDALTGLLAALRDRLELRARGELQGVATPTAVPLSLPALDHVYCGSGDLGRWWSRTLLGDAHVAAVRAFVLQQCEAEDGAERLRSHDWLRVLVHRLACERREGAMLRVLHDIYRETAARAVLVARDAEFAATVDLARFGGPWSSRLGLDKPRARKRPFALGKAGASAPADVTVLVPSYRHEAYVGEAIRSVLAQRYGGFKLLVVDDGSPDETVARARAVKDPRIEVRVNEQNLGLGNSVLRALESVDTPFVALLNSDDLFHPDRLARCRDVLLGDPSVQLVTTGLSLVDENGGQITKSNASLVLDGRLVYDWVHWYERAQPPTDLPHDQLFARLLENNFLATSSNLVARTDWLRAQAESLRSLKYCLDWQLFLQAALEGSLHHVHEPLAAYRLHSSNTVWFREGRRWAYYLEVNRVASTALQRVARTGRVDDERGVLRILDAIEAHLARNRETDGYAMLLHSAVDALKLEGFAEASAEIQRRIQNLNRAAEHVRAACDHAADESPAGADRRRMLRVLLGEIAEDQARQERDARRWLQGYVDDLELRLQECWDARRGLEQQKAEALHRADHLAQKAGRLPGLEAEIARAQSAAAAEAHRASQLESDLAGVRQDREVVRSELGTSRGEIEALRQELGAIRRELDALRQDLDGRRAELANTRAELDRLNRDVATNEVERRSLADQLAARELALAEELRRHDQLTAVLAAGRDDLARREAAHDLERAEWEARLHAASLEIAQQSSRVSSLESMRSELEGALATVRVRAAEQDAAMQVARSQREDCDRTIVGLREELEALRKSREFRAGNFLWNKLPLGYASRRGKKWYRRMLDAKSRGLLWLSRLFSGKKRASGVAVVTACWQWPIYSHTFVYQEMIALSHMGLDVQLFHWEQGDMGQLHKAFGYLAEHRTLLQPVWENHLRDRDHFEKTKPGRLKAFLERVSKAVGKPVEELEKEPIVLQGCTFARMAELAGARYLHSYFFYDQSFMAMQAAWLLGIPRGVSCYADHMLDDYPWKLVPLQVELSDVVVATSARIKRELSAKSNGKFDHKIVVKPNGVDGARFPAVARPARKKGEPIEVVSISRIEPKKGLTHLVEAVAILKKRGIEVKAHVVGSKDLHSKGSAEYAETFDRCIREQGVEDLVIQHGMMKQEDLAPILKRCRAFVAPYVELGTGDKDGIPTAMLEGLASGLPVVTTDSGSILEVVDDGVEGIVVKQRDSEAFANALQRLVEDPALEQRMSNAARSRFDRDFDIRVTEKRLHERVAALLAQKQKAK